MAAADIGAGGSNYVGNAGIGGGNFGVAKIDTRPLQELAHYTFLYNRSEYDQRQKDMELAAAQLAEITSYDPNSPIPGDTKKGHEFIDNLVKYATDNNGKVLDYRNKKEWAQYNKDKAETATAIGWIKTRAIEYKAIQERIAGETNPKMKKLLQEKLDKQANSTDIYTHLRLPEYDIKPVNMTAPGRFKVDVTLDDGNTFIQKNLELPDMKDVNNQAATAEAGLNELILGKGTEAFEYQTASGKMEPVESAKYISGIISQYKTPTGEIDFQKLRAENAENTILIGHLDQIETYNGNMKMMLDGFRDGTFRDSTNPKLQFAYGPINEKDYAMIDLSKGSITTRELLKVRALGMAASPNIKTDIVQSDNALDAQRLRVQWAQYGLEKRKLDDADNGDILAADGIIREMADIINAGDKQENMVTVAEKGKKDKQVFKIGDPNILLKFATIDKDGKTTRIPDEARYNPKTNEIDLVYFRKITDRTVVKKPGENYEDGDVSTTTENTKIKGNITGGRQIEEVKPLNVRTWANMISQRTFGGNDRGKVNEIVQAIITRSGGDVYKLAKSLGNIQPPEVKEEPPKTKTKVVKVKGL